ncbi:hypothetical protein ACFE04_001181 [Oxalis oulophora]
MDVETTRLSSSPPLSTKISPLNQQLGFRKIDTDRWEFANEAFQRGQKHLLKTIQRRKSPNSQQGGAHFALSTETGQSGLEDIENLRKEKTLLMQEMIELQQQHRGTTRHMETVNKRLQDAEQRQKQMVSFLGKLVQNPAFVARLQQSKKEDWLIGCSRPKRKFLKQQKHEVATFDQIVKYEPVVPELDQFPGGQSEFGLESLPFHIENIALDTLVVSDELAQSVVIEEGPSSFKTEDPLFKGKNIMSSEGVGPEYFDPFPDNLMENCYPGISSPGMESIPNQEEIWNMGFGSTENWSNVQYDASELEVTEALSDFWDIDCGQVAGISGVGNWPADDEYPSGEPDSHADQ